MKEGFFAALMWVIYKMMHLERRKYSQPIPNDRRCSREKLSLKTAKKIERKAIDRFHQAVESMKK